ncbi:MAG: hypothetical protein F6K48_07650 [Okeania sp. SIO3H1]|uniref:hypothetical protein n=1 Tax=Okeania sp. SIO1I7 TaxID=2607772 RepID=UPI0013CD8810|nr:hypothetical protein [Okeania sp. SIO1I7]NEN88800.1 hypothetical protein [Okeania sp. SIO3H1]NET28334.1 hypothetical protein [Okeania sp. SIO1I7]
MSAQLLTKIIFSTLTTGIITIFLPQPSFAEPYETNTVNPLKDLQTVDNPDPFSGSGGLNMFDIIHNSRLGNNRNMKEYMLEQRDSLNDAATQFRNKQQQLIQPSQNAVGDTPASTVGESEINP